MDNLGLSLKGKSLNTGSPARSATTPDPVRTPAQEDVQAQLAATHYAALAHRESQAPASPARSSGRAEGAAGPFLTAKNWSRWSLEQLAAAPRELRALHDLVEPGGARTQFLAKAAEIDTYKQGRLNDLGAAPHPIALGQVVEDANILHGKANHTQNVLDLLKLVLAAHPQPEGAAMQEAARWLNLADLELPTAILAAPRRLTDEEQQTHIAPRGERAADLFRKLNLGGDAVEALIRTHRSSAERPFAAQLLDLVDQAAAMAAKPFFQTDGTNGRVVDGPKLSAALQKGNAVKANVDRGALDVLTGYLGRATLSVGADGIRQREVDGYLR